MGLALTGKVAPYKTGFGPLPGEVFHAPFPNAVHGVSVAAALKGVEHILKTEIEPQRVAAILFEPIQGEGGFNASPTDFVLGLQAICKAHGILLIADEIQTGFGRTAKFFAMEHYGVAPDLITFAKSVAGGMPLSGVVGRAEVMDAVPPGGLGSTFAGNPLSIAAAHAVLDIIDDEHLVARAGMLGSQLRDRLLSLSETVPQLRDVRGPGSMVGVEFCKAGGLEPDPEFTQRIQSRALAAGLLLLTCGAYGNVIRFLYPLTIPQATFDEALDILETAITAEVRGRIAA
jgi:4-aminobutyrate aminotransferase